ncbi:hypothetical protein PVK06_026597 [Gossypium arboreum]|uniref:UBN2 domain-containing protein n=1 Tax=Gossypium arboreum TaxID=29729 RepID=A0ABR0NZD4_GOSAR|nr:hypothetical protein PVK06_026597 [Gossypium arboreum]
MSDRFTIIINGLKSFGKIYPNVEVVRKMIQSLPKSWEANVPAIEEAKNLETLTLDELIGSLLTHEMRLNEGDEEEKLMKKKKESNKQKHKANFSTLSDENSSDDEDQEVANRCFMAINDSKEKVYYFKENITKANSM